MVQLVIPGMRRWFSLGLLFPALAGGAEPAGWSMRVWQTGSGLPNNNITSIAQTADGYIWVATSGHLARFDGIHFEEFTSKGLLPMYSGYTARASALLSDRDGGLWLAMVHGPVVRLDSDHTEIFTNSLPEFVAQGIVQDGDGAIWITYHGGIVCRIDHGRVNQFTEQDGLPVKFDCALASDEKGRVWFAKDGRVGVYRHQHFETVADSLPKSAVITRADGGGIWVCSARELFKCDDSGQLHSVGVFTVSSNTTVTALFEDASHAVWIGTTASGLLRYDGSRFETVPTSHSSISSVFEDRKGNLWVGTGGGGLDRIQPRAFVMETTETGLPFDTVQSVCEDSAHTIWAVTQNSMLACQRDGRWSTVSTNANWPGGRPTCVTAGGDGVWIGTAAGVVYFLKDGKFTGTGLTNSSGGRVVRGLLNDAAGDLWILADDPESVQCLHGGQLKTFPLPSNLGVLRAIVEDPAKNIWIGSSKGCLLRIRDGIVTDETTNVAGASTSIRALAVTADGTLWIGYASGGLGRFKDGHFARIASARGLFNDYISQIVADDAGWLWLDSDRGLFKVKQEDLAEVAAGRLDRVQSIHYGEGDTLPSLQANFGQVPGVWRSHDGKLWFPNRTALVVVTLQNLRENSDPPPVLLKEVIMDDTRVAAYGGTISVQPLPDVQKPQAPLRLPPRLHRLEFQFTALCFDAPENVRFQYRLLGFDNHWLDSDGDRSARYPRLNAGGYEFQVRVRNGVGSWGEPCAFAFAVTPFFWQTWWWRLAVFVVFTCSVIVLVRYISFRRLRSQFHALEQQAALDKERARIARDIHDDLGGSLTQIKLLFELALRQRAEPGKIDLLGQEGLATTRRTIKSLDEIVWAVNPQNDTLPHLIEYIGQFAIEFLSHAGIRCRVDLPHNPVNWNVTPETRHNLFLVVKEALNNVIVHAEATEVWLRVAATDQLLTINIEDNGHGFAPGANNHFADGLSNINQRMSEIGGQASINGHSGTGTVVSLKLPKPGGK